MITLPLPPFAHAPDENFDCGTWLGQGMHVLFAAAHATTHRIGLRAPLRTEHARHFVRDSPPRHPTMASALRPIRWVQIPYQVPYLHGSALQESVVARRLSAKRFLEESPGPTPALRHQPPSRAVQKAQSVALQDYLFLLEHTPVYTEGRRKGAKEAIADDEEGRRLRALGAQYIVAQRGGLITFHGPGQLVGYPILDLAQMNVSSS